jgi:hypothetical protein
LRWYLTTNTPLNIPIAIMSAIPMEKLKATEKEWFLMSTRMSTPVIPAPGATPRSIPPVMVTMVTARANSPSTQASRKRFMMFSPDANRGSILENIPNSISVVSNTP